MSRFDLSGRARALRRGVGVVLFQPPPEHMNTIAWHLISTGTRHGFPLLAQMQWRPGIQRWIDKDGVSVPAEKAGELDWTYVGYHGPDLHRGKSA